MAQPTDAVRDDSKTAQGAVPFSYGSQPSTAGPEHHVQGASDPSLPGKQDLALEPQELNPPRPERPTWKAKVLSFKQSGTPLD